MANDQQTGIGGRFAPTGREKRWPIVFRSLSMALQGPRLALGLLIFVILMACGSIWDAASPKRVEFVTNVAPLSVRALDFDFYSVLDREDRERLEEMEELTYLDVRSATINRYRVRMDQSRLELLEPRDDEHADQIRQRMEQYRADAHQAIETLKRIYPPPPGVFRYTTDRLSEIGTSVIASLWTLELSTAWNGIRGAWAGVGGLFGKLWSDHKVFSIVFGVLAILLFCVGGGAISRLTAVDLAEGRALRATQGIGFAVARSRDLLLSIIFFPLVALLLGVVIAIVWGILLGFPVLNIIGALLYLPALLMGLLIVLIGVGFVACFSLMIPAIAAEETDGYDAQQRAYAYLLARPGNLLLYTVLALIQGAVALTLIWLIALASLNLTAHLAGLIGGSDVVTMAGGWGRLLEEREVWMLTGTQRFAAGVIGIWRAILAAFVAAFIVSFYFTSQTIIYLLMRWTVDGEAIERSDMSGERA